MDIFQVAEKFDQFLYERNICFEGVLIGGAALVLLKIVDRATKDFDLLNQEIVPKKVIELAAEFAYENNLPLDWLNNNPAGLTRDLPNGWESRLVEIFKGKALIFKGLHRSDLLKSKIWALCDRMRDLPDVLALNPSKAELESARKWLIPLDANPDWPVHVDTIISTIKEKLNHG